MSQKEVVGLSGVYPLLLSIKGINQEVDIFSSTVKIGKVSMTFSNAPYNPMDAVNRRLSSLWSNLGRGTVDIYIHAGTGSFTIANCLHVFSGHITDHPEFTRDIVTLKASDKNRYYHKDLPQTYVKDVYPDAPLDKRYLRLPVQYGEFSLRGADHSKLSNGNGPAPCMKIDDGKFCISDHVLNDTMTAWMQVPGCGGLLAEFHNVWGLDTMTEDDSGRGTVTIEVNDDAYQKAYAYLYPAAVGASNDADDPINACSDDDEYALIVLSGDSLILFFLDDFGPGDNDEGNGVGTIVTAQIEWRGEAAENASVSGGTLKISSNAGFNSATAAVPADLNTWQALSATSLDWITAISGIWWMLNRGNEDDKAPVHLEVAITGTPSGGELAHIYAVRVKLYFSYETSLVEEIFAECKGREFGSWIDDADHSNAFNSGDLIEHPNYIVESILIDELGIPISDIDCESFDLAYDQYLKMKVSLHNGEIRNSLDIIKEISQQGTFALHCNAEGKWRLVSWSRNVNPENYEFTWIEDDYIEAPEKLKICRSSWRHLVNSLRVYYEYRYGTEKYNKSALYEDSASQTKYGTIDGEIKMRYLDDDSAEYLADKLIDSGLGLLSNDWIGVKFRAKGRTYAHLEVGDYIRFRRDILAPDGKVDTIEWQNVDFMIMKKSLDIDGCNFEAYLTPGRFLIEFEDSAEGNAIADISAVNPTTVELQDVTPP